MEGLPGRMRRCIELAYFSAADYREIAAATGIPVNTVKSLIRRGLQRLRDAFEDLPPPG